LRISLQASSILAILVYNVVDGALIVFKEDGCIDDIVSNKDLSATFVIM